MKKLTAKSTIAKKFKSGKQSCKYFNHDHFNWAAMLLKFHENASAQVTQLSDKCFYNNPAKEEKKKGLPIRTQELEIVVVE